MEPQPHEHSPLALFLQADWIVKSIMLLLIAASVLVWAIVLDRSVRMSKRRPQVSLLSEAARYSSQDPEPGLAIEIMNAGQEASNERRREAVPFTTVVTAVSEASPWFAPARRTALTKPHRRCFVMPAFHPSRP